MRIAAKLFSIWLAVRFVCGPVHIDRAAGVGFGLFHTHTHILAYTSGFSIPVAVMNGHQSPGNVAKVLSF